MQFVALQLFYQRLLCCFVFALVLWTVYDGVNYFFPFFLFYLRWALGDFASTLLPCLPFSSCDICAWICEIRYDYKLCFHYNTMCVCCVRDRWRVNAKIDFSISSTLKMFRTEWGREHTHTRGVSVCHTRVFALTAAATAAARVPIDLIETLFICSKEIEIFEMYVCVRSPRFLQSVDWLMLLIFICSACPFTLCALLIIIDAIAICQ